MSEHTPTIEECCDDNPIIVAETYGNKLDLLCWGCDRVWIITLSGVEYDSKSDTFRGDTHTHNWEHRVLTPYDRWGKICKDCGALDLDGENQ